MKDIKLAAIVVTYNRKELLVECLKALKNQDKLLNRIYLVDNGSIDGTYEFIKKNRLLEDKLIIYKKLDENTGGAGGFHYGLKEAFEEKYDWYWLMDDDSIVQKNTLNKLIKSNAFLDKKTGVLNSAIIDINGKYINTQKLYNWTTGKYTIKELTLLNNTDEIEVDVSSFVGFFVRHNVINKIGLPNKSFFFQFDDNDYSLSVRKAGYKNVLVFDSIIRHKIDSTLDEAGVLKIESLWKFYYGNRNSIYLGINKIEGRLNKLVFVLYNFARLIKHLLLNVTLEKTMLRNKIWLLSFSHGVLGKLGKTIDPVIYLKKNKKS